VKSRILSSITAITLFAALAIPIGLAAQDDTAQANKPKHHHYQLIDMGTFGGPSSYINSPANLVPALNRRGTTVGGSGTPVPTMSTSSPFCSGGLEGLNPEVYQAFEWRTGVVSDLGSLAGANYCSDAGSINARGKITGNSENGLVDPVVGVNETRAVVWENGQITDLGTLGGNHSLGLSINDSGQVVGLALNAVPDPFSVLDFLIFGSSSGTQTRAFLWDKKNGMQDLGTLGGPDAWASTTNERGQIAGQSYTNSTPNSSTGFPTLDPFLWDKGTMRDLGTLGGVVGFTAALNSHGQVVGGSSIASDPGACYVASTSSIEFANPDCHPFLWDQGSLTDLYTSTAGANPITVSAINDSGEIVGVAVFPNAPFDAYLWRSGVATDLGTLNADCFSAAFAINSRNQVVGWSASCDGSDERAFLWEDGSIADLSTLIPQGSSLDPAWGMAINERGEIAGIGVPPRVLPANLAVQGHAFLLIPCDENHPGIEGCDYSLVDATATPRNTAPVTQRLTTTTPANPALSGRGMLDRLRARRFPWYHVPAPGTGSTN